MIGDNRKKLTGTKEVRYSGGEGSPLTARERVLRRQDADGEISSQQGELGLRGGGKYSGVAVKKVKALR